MPLFRYNGRNTAGDAINGSQQAATAQALAEQLQSQQITPVTINEVTSVSDGQQSVLSTDINLFQRVKIDELILFSRQMHSLTKAGVPITQAIRGLALSVRNSLLRRTLHDVVRSLEQGLTLSSSLHQHTKIFGSLYISVIHVGENSGQLEQSFKRIGEYLELERDTLKSLKAATRYPLFVLCAIGLAMLVINLFVLPNFADMFSRMNAELPLMTQVLFAISNVFQQGWWLMLIGGVAMLWGWHKYKNSAQGGLAWDRFKLKIPIVGNLFERITLGRFSRMLSLSLASGVPIVQSLSIIANAVGNHFVAHRILDMQAGIERGETLTQAAQHSGMFTPLVLQMIAVGEETGQVEDMLEQTADFYDQEVGYDLKGLASAIEPLLIVTIAGMVLVLALGVFLPLWELSGAVNR